MTDQPSDIRRTPGPFNEQTPADTGEAPAEGDRAPASPTRACVIDESSGEGQATDHDPNQLLENEEGPAEIEGAPVTLDPVVGEQDLNNETKHATNHTDDIEGESASRCSENGEQVLVSHEGAPDGAMSVRGTGQSPIESDHCELTERDEGLYLMSCL